MIRTWIAISFAVVLSPTLHGNDSDADVAKTLAYVQSLYDPGSGGFRPMSASPPSLRATSAAIRVLPKLGGKLPDREKTASFLRRCYDAKSGGFAEPGEKAEVFTTAVGIMAVVELKLPRQDFSASLTYLAREAKTFEDIRIAAAAVEAWGVRDCPFDLKPWFEKADAAIKPRQKSSPREDGARDLGSYAAFRLRLGENLPQGQEVVRFLRDGQRSDGGWGKGQGGPSDLESTYRVMRALWLLKAAPAHSQALDNFLQSCRNSDGGYGTQPGQPSSLSGTYYAIMVHTWMHELRR
jgi:hypothetical protein